MKTPRTSFSAWRAPISALCSIGLVLILPAAIHGATRVVAWGRNLSGQTNVPASANGAVAIAAGAQHSLALKDNGTVVAWGANESGQATVPAGLSSVRAVSGGAQHTLALRSNGVVVAWGDNFYGQSTVPAGLTGVTAISADEFNSFALRPNGTPAFWGGNCTDPVDLPPGLTNLVVIAAGAGCARGAAVRADGTVIEWGRSPYLPAVEIPSGLRDVVVVAMQSSSSDPTIALKADGTVVAWGGSNTVVETTIPVGLSNVVSIAAGFSWSLALKVDGTVVGWGYGSFGETNPPAGLSNVTALAAGGNYALALVGDGTPAFARRLPDRTIYGGTDLILSAGAVGAPPLSYQWLLNGAAVDGETNATLSIPNMQADRAGTYAVVVSNSLGSVSQSAVVNAAASAPIVFTRVVNQTNAAGTSTRFRVTADGTRPIHYQWQLNGAAIDGATNASLNLSSVAPMDGGTYSVLVSNLFGTTSANIATLTVLTNFSLVAGPQSRTVPVGFPLSFSVALNGIGPFHYQWRFDGQAISGATNASLLLPSVTATAAGSYDVIAGNPFLSVTSAPAVVTVLTNGTNVVGQFVSDFDSGSPPGASRFGKTSIGTGGVGGSGVLKLMTNGTFDSFGDFVIDDFSGGAPVTAFFASFDLLLGGGSIFPADGFSFNFATNFYRPPNASTFSPPLREDGFTNGLSVSLDIWESDEFGPDTAPAIEARVFGRLIAFQAMAGGNRAASGHPPAGPYVIDPVTGQPLISETEPPAGQGPLTRYAPFTIELKTDGTLWVTYKGVLVLSNVQTALPPITGGKFAFGARVGGAELNMWIDNLGIQTSTGLRPVAFATSGPTNKTVGIGQTATFLAEPVGSPPLRLQWFSNEVAIAGATNATHTTPPATALNQGDVYRIEVGNPLSTGSRSATLTVLVPPIILVGVSNRTAVAGDDVTFCVTVTNYATLPLYFRWRKSSTTLTNIALDSRTCCFTLFNVSTNITATNGAGSYDVIVTNAASFAPGIRSGPVTLTILPATAPTATTLSAGDLTSGGATLNGSVNPMGAQTVAWFDYGLTATYGNRSGATKVGNAAGFIAFTQAASGLLTGTNYHYRVVATNYGGMALGADVVFQTSAVVAPPTISAYVLLGDGQFRLHFTSTPGTGFSVQVSTNLNDWLPLGPATETTPGQFEFTDTEAANHSQRFYRLRSP